MSPSDPSAHLHPLVACPRPAIPDPTAAQEANVGSPFLGVHRGIENCPINHTGYQLYHVLVRTNTGDMNIVSTRDEDFARRVDRAINDAIIARG